MPPAVLIRLRPLGPWRYGAGEGGKDHVDKMFRSDRLYSAVTLAMQQLGVLEEWLDTTARAVSPQVSLSSLFPFQGDSLFAPPPRSLWPPPSNLVTAPSPVFLAKIRWDAAQFVPLSAIDSMLTGRALLAEQWVPDPESGCLLRRDRPNTSPFRVVMRTRTAVDRLTQSAVHGDSYACVEFESNSGLWGVLRFADDAAQTQWGDRVKSAFRLLADTGFGGGRSCGWGQTAAPEFQDGRWPRLLLPQTARANADGSVSQWLLSLYSPAKTDTPDWSSGDYELVMRGAYSGRKSVRMIAEGSVVASTNDLAGVAVDIAPEGAEHPIFRAGFALALRLPEITVLPQDIKPVEEPSDVEAPEVKPCDVTPQEEVPPQAPEAAEEPPVAEARASEDPPEPEPQSTEQTTPETAPNVEEERHGEL